ncbi:hypothetical protein ABKA04_005895 [Annulohypoxylon sp. FPYF3050]
MRFASSVIGLAATASTAAAAVSAANSGIKGFNYGAFFLNQAAKQQADFEYEFNRAKSLSGTSGWTSARLYTMVQWGTASDVISAIPAAISTKTTLLLGLWVSGGDQAIANEIAALKAAITQYGTAFTDLVVGISVGSEDLYRDANNEVGVSGPTLINYISQVRSAIAGTALAGVPVGHVDTYDSFLNATNSDVINNIDWLGFDGYPYWEETKPNSIGDAPERFYDGFNKTLALAGNKPVYVTETGWPTSGKTVNQAVPSVENARIYWQDIACSLIARGVNLWWYDLQESQWGTADPDFGIFPAGDLNTVSQHYDLSCGPDNPSPSYAVPAVSQPVVLIPLNHAIEERASRDEFSHTTKCHTDSIAPTNPDRPHQKENDAIRVESTNVIETADDLKKLLGPNQLWTAAYEKIKEHPKVKAYERLLQEQENLKRTDNTESQLLNWQEQVQTDARKRLEACHKNMLSFSVGSNKIAVRDQVRKVIGFIVSAKDLVASAISSEPHAALAWAGVMFIFPLLNEMLQKDVDALNGFDDITTILVRCKVIEDGYLTPTSREMENIKIQLRNLEVVSKTVENVGLDASLSKLSPASSAAFNYYDNNERQAHCTQGTRLEILSELQKWIQNPTGEPILWLHGMAGTGKSTIARTVAKALNSMISLTGGHRLPNNVSLGATFFFKRDDDTRNSANVLFRTLAYQLAYQRLDLKSRISDAVEQSRNHNIQDQSPTAQWDTLILEPLKTLQKELCSTLRIVLVIDALDEYELSHNDMNRSGSFEWPNQNDFRKLVERTGGLFIYAATACRFLDVTSETVAERRLKTLLSGSTNKNSPESTLNDIYRKVLSQVSDEFNEQEDDLLERIKEILRVIAVLFKPLPACSLAEFAPSGMREINVKEELKDLRPVVDLPEDSKGSVNLVHLSFREFLLDEDKCGGTGFLVQPSTMHFPLFRRCLEIMSNDLHEDICGLQKPGTLSIDVPLDLVQQHISPHLQYACRYWIDHLLAIWESPQARGALVDGGIIHMFLQKYILNWLEVLGLTKEVGSVTLLVSRVNTLIDEREHPELSKLIYDAHRFILFNRRIIEDIPLQIYYSAVFFSPTKSIIKSLFRKPLDRWIVNAPVVDKGWGAERMTLEIQNTDYNVSSIAVSLDNQTIAAVAGRQVRVWEVATGIEKISIPRDVNKITLSPDGQLVAMTPAKDAGVQVHDLRTDENYLLSETLFPFHMIFHPSIETIYDIESNNILHYEPTPSSDFDYLVDWKTQTDSADDMKVDNQAATSTAVVRKVRKHVKSSRATTFFPNGKAVAHAVGSTIQINDVIDDETDDTQPSNIFQISSTSVVTSDHALIVTLSGDQEYHFEILDLKKLEVQRKFTHDLQDQIDKNLCNGKIVVTFLWGLASFDNCLIWNITTGEQIRQFKDVNAVQFSPDGDIKAKLLPEEHTDIRMKLALFSPDGTQFAIPTEQTDNDWGETTDIPKINFWDTTTGENTKTLEIDSKYGMIGNILAISLDGKVAINTTKSGVMVWDPLINKWSSPTGHSIHSQSMLSFSEDGKYLNGRNGRVPSSSSIQDYNCLYLDGDWVLQGGEKLLWLPPAYRGYEHSSLVKGGTIIIGGCDSIPAIFIKVDLEKTPLAKLKEPLLQVEQV